MDDIEIRLVVDDEEQTPLYRGEPGPKGDQGPEGPIGPRGPEGKQGPQGQKGDRGDLGPVGPQGLRGLKGEGLPGRDSTVPGPKGDTGDKGDPGAQGPQGPQGNAGPKGDKGDRGEIGPSGKDGVDGKEGPQGKPGIMPSEEIIAKVKEVVARLPIPRNSGGGGGTNAYAVKDLVTGPASAVNNRVAFFDGATGKLIKDSGLTLSGSNTGDQTSVSGNAGTATALQTARTIGGKSFDGTANIVPAGLILQSVEYVEAADIAATGSYAAMVTQAITTVAGSYLLVEWTTYCSGTGGGNLSHFKLTADSTDIYEITQYQDTLLFPTRMSAKITGLSAASHTIYIKWYTSAGTLVCNASSAPTANNSRMVIQEIST